MSDQTRPAVADYLSAQRIAFAPLLFQAVRTAREQGVLSGLAAAPEGLSLDEIVASTGLSSYAARLLIDACESLEVVVRDDEKYRISGTGLVLLEDRHVGVNLDFTHHVCYRGAFYLDRALTEGRPAGLPTLGEWGTIYEGVPHLPPPIRDSWYAFDHQYSDIVFPRAIRYLMSRGVRRILDVGGNTGRFAVRAAKHMDVTILDHPSELALASENARAAGVADRVSTHAIDLLDAEAPFPAPYDAVWMSQVLDCFSADQIVHLLRRGHAALGAGGHIYVVESFADRQPAEPGRLLLHALSLYFACMANGNSRMYRASEFHEYAERAGLTVVEDRTLGPWHTLLVLAGPTSA